VTFNGIAAPILYVTPELINVLVPYTLAGQKAAEVVVSHAQQRSAAFSVPVADTSLGIFTGAEGGISEGILNHPGYTPNSDQNPVAAGVPGSAIVLFATGFGVWDLPVDAISVTAVAYRAKTVSLTIGGLPAPILYAGVAPFRSNGMLQVNALVPAGVAPGRQPVVLTIGQNDNARQNVTIAVK
jgi:uncharacterized protein (TIGR03437 family)